VLSSNVRILSLKRLHKPAGRLWKLLRSNSRLVSEGKLPRSLGSASSDKLQSLSDNDVTWKEGGNRLVGLGIFLGRNHDFKREGNVAEVEPLQPQSDKSLRFFNLTMVLGTCLMTVSSALRIVKDSKSPKSSGNSSNFEQPER
jgi:hypothetical protein